MHSTSATRFPAISTMPVNSLSELLPSSRSTQHVVVAPPLICR